MKKRSFILFSMVAMVCTLFLSCAKDKLDGTTWVMDRGMMVVTLSFSDSRFEMEFDQMGDKSTEKGTYTFVDPKVTLSTETETLEGTVQGDEMSFTQDGMTVVYVKKK